MAQFAETVLPRVRMDYGFLTEEAARSTGEHGESDAESAGASLTIAVMQESLAKSVWSYAVESKGSMEEWMVQQAIEDLETVGLKNERLVLKSDQENSITDVMKEIQKARECEFGTALDNSRVGDSDSNGTIENAVGSVEGMCRTLRVALEDKLKQKVAITDPVIPWLVRHAGHLITKCWIRPSGRTAYQLIKGRRSNVRMKEFGEAVWFRIPQTKTMPGKFEPRWEDGVYLGFNIRTGEDLVSNEQGVFRVSTVRRKPDDERWSKTLLDSIVGTPAIPVPSTNGRRMPAYARKFAKTEEEKKAPEFAAPEVPEVRARTWRITKEDVQTHGATEGCPGCRAIMRGAMYKSAHTPACRLRFEGILQGTEEGRERMGRADERLAHDILRREGVDPYAANTGPQGGDDAPDAMDGDGTTAPATTTAPPHAN